MSSGLDAAPHDRPPAALHDTLPFRVLITSLSTYSAPYNDGKLDHLVGRVESLKVVAGDLPTLWETENSTRSCDGYDVEVLPLRFKRNIALAHLVGLRDVVTAARPNLIHVECEPWQDVAVQSVRLARHLGVPVGIQFAENGPLLRGFGGVLRRTVGTQVLKRCDYAVGWSTESTRIAKRWVPSIRTDTFPGTGVSPGEKRSGTADRWFGVESSGMPKLAFVGRFDEEKGISDFLDVCDQLSRQLAIRVALAGGGQERELVEQWASTRPWVFVHGVLPRPDAQSLLAAADALVVSSLSRRSVKEQFGKAPAEAMAVGTPVFAYDSGALPEVIGKGGVVVQEGAIDQLVAALECYFNSPTSSRAALEAQAKAQATQFTDDSIASRLVELWSSL